MRLGLILSTGTPLNLIPSAVSNQAHDLDAAHNFPGIRNQSNPDCRKLDPLKEALQRDDQQTRSSEDLGPFWRSFLTLVYFMLPL